MTMFNTPGQQPTTTGKRGNKEKKDEVTGKLLAIETYLPFLADKLGCNALHEVHRLDATTTGVLLFSKTAAMRDTLKKLFAQRKVEKTYRAITNKKTSQRDSLQAVTEYKILSNFNSA